jgi:aspartyl-tRNA(Asn)/glutamyl-tRNA(Gln) amidotransferase subunit A
VDIEVLSAYDEALKTLRSMGGSVRDVDIDYLSYAPVADFTILRVEGFNIHRSNLQKKSEQFGRGCFRQLVAGAYLSGSDYFRALQARALISNAVAKAFEDIDVLVTPTTPQTAAPGKFPAVPTDVKVARSGVAFLAPFNLTGSPAITVPCGFNRAHLPVGMQFVGRAYEDATILRCAHAYQSMTSWHTRRPLMAAK